MTSGKIRAAIVVRSQKESDVRNDASRIDQRECCKTVGERATPGARGSGVIGDPGLVAGPAWCCRDPGADQAGAPGGNRAEFCATCCRGPMLDAEPTVKR